MSPTLADIPDVGEITAIDCLFTQVVQINEVSRRCGTLPGPLADLRRAVLNKLREHHSASAIAAEVGLSRGRIFQLTENTGRRAQRPRSTRRP